MAGRNGASEKEVRRLLRSLGRFSVEDETEAALNERGGPDGTHPAQYDIESFVAGDLFDAALRATIAAHLETCAPCRAEAEAFRAFLPETAPPVESEKIVSLASRRRSGFRPVFTMPEAAAAAGGDIGQRNSADATIRVTPVAAIPGMHVITIQLVNPALRPQILRLDPPSGEAMEEELPPPDENGLIQFVKTIASPEDEAFVKYLLDAPLEFLDRADD